MTYSRFVVTDLETTGHAAKGGDRIIQASFVIVENKQIIEQYTTLFNPKRQIPAFIEELTGIRNNMVQEAPLFREEASKILPLLKGAVFVAHNVPFDLHFLQAELEEAGCLPFSGPSIDTVELARMLYPTLDSYKLNDLAVSLGVHHDRPHRADSDAYVTAELLLKMMEKLNGLPLVTLEKMEQLAVHLKSDIYLLLQAVIAEKQHHIEHLPESVEVYRGLALRKKTIQKKYQENKGYTYPSRQEEKLDLLTQIPHYEQRDSQLKMMDQVYRSMETNTHLAVEAGTGTGKSLGYLLPAVYRSKMSDRPVVVSTHTIILQQQLMHKEIGQLKAILPFPVLAAVLKGRSHYIDLYKFHQSLKETNDNYDYALAKIQILTWLLETETGDADELNLSSGGWLFWNEVKQDGAYMNKGRKAWLEKDFYALAKKRAEEADIVIINHSLLLADLMAKSSLLPHYSHVIIDEAHHFEKAARERLGRSLDAADFKYLVAKAGTYQQEGLFYQCEQLHEKYSGPPNEESGRSLIDRLLHELMLEGEEWFGTWQSFFERYTKKRSGNGHRRQLRLTEDTRQLPYWKHIEYGAERIDEAMSRICAGLKRRLESLSAHREQMSAAEQMKLDELRELLEEWEAFIQNIEQLIFRPEEDEVIWMEGDSRSFTNTFIIKSHPVSPADLIRQKLLDCKHVIFTSATLTVNQSFRFFAEQTGLNEMVYDKVILPSPFDYERNCRMIIPSDVPEIKGATQEEYIEALANHLTATADAAEGRMLVLFTAYDMMRKTYDLMKDSGLLEEYVLLAQGISNGSRNRLARNFKRFDKAILFGTNSFWEGIDIPGEDLSCLVIVRLPFSPPDDPYTQAKHEQYAKQGKSAFTAYSLPQAVLRFKQGVGRLIRSSQDRGIIIVFDRRIQMSAYGRTFLDSIPGIPVREATLGETVSIIENWLQLCE
ncbi:ATP-dependent DNA helicase DinG [Bacillus xiapuensis]|uniref:ATP-dependent DNA helicase DinG n=1 Tax=Bacillus xiapuensis TaxID=2014075 RepID=UPI000C24744B|nr:ATP-dependent DNA helicase DinG [Bacillus xiapuensis]